MEKHFLDPNTLLGRIVTSKEKYEVVHLSLKAGNEVPEYKNESEILIFVIEGEILLKTEEDIVLKSFELAEVPSSVEHKMIAVKDSQVMAVKIK
ncbi:MAG: cupin domain-containing protein [Catonella sp.]|uniref:cupin domain-containing protein n=1 Tax=Catonella sp. TaxID=2382125 RepID=UPI003FA0E012